MKVIPAIDLMNGQVVRLYKGDPNHKTVYSNNPIEIAKKWEANGADMLHLVDLDATLGSGSNLLLIKKILEQITIFSGPRFDSNFFSVDLSLNASVPKTTLLEIFETSIIIDSSRSPPAT